MIAPAPAFAHFLARSLDEIRLCAAGNVTILLQILRVLARIAADTPDPARREALLLHARLAADLADTSVPARYDRERINAALATTREALHASHAALPSLAPERPEMAQR